MYPYIHPSSSSIYVNTEECVHSVVASLWIRLLDDAMQYINEKLSKAFLGTNKIHFISIHSSCPMSARIGYSIRQQQYQDGAEKENNLLQNYD